MKMKTIVILFVLFVTSCVSYSNVPGSCNYPNPFSNQIIHPVSLNPPGPFSFNISTSYVPGQTFNVTLMGTNTTFLGFLLWALDANNHRQGSWTPSLFAQSGPTSLFPVTCLDGTVVGHTLQFKQLNAQNISIPWTAPRNGVGNLRFSAFVVTNTNISANVVSAVVTGPGQAPNSSGIMYVSIFTILIMILAVC